MDGCNAVQGGRQRILQESFQEWGEKKRVSKPKLEEEKEASPPPPPPTEFRRKKLLCLKKMSRSNFVWKRTKVFGACKARRRRSKRQMGISKDFVTGGGGGEEEKVLFRSMEEEEEEEGGEEDVALSQTRRPSWLRGKGGREEGHKQIKFFFRWQDATEELLSLLLPLSSSSSSSSSFPVLSSVRHRCRRRRRRRRRCRCRPPFVSVHPIHSFPLFSS